MPLVFLREGEFGLVVFFFFFYKQKTAYEFDCDWISDVCSSDLFGIFADLSLPRVGARHAYQADRNGSVQVRRVQAERVDQDHAQPGLLEERPPLPRRYRVQIGRASCRERV